MAKPATLQALVEVIRASRLVPEDRLTLVLTGLSSESSTDLPGPRLLNQLISKGNLTPFQAQQLAVGRWKGFVVGNYVLTGKIGSGGMGQVYSAVHRTTNRQVAVKVLNPRSLCDATALLRFEREAKAAAGLVHQNIVRVLDVNTKSNPPYLVMEFIDGVTWQAAVARSGTLTAEWVAYLGRQIANGLQCAHEAGTVHRDIKPANLLLDRRGQAKILDLGIARIVDDSGLTKAHSKRVILGTADYLAPEQAVNSSEVDSRADLYALGGTLYFLLAGHPPFPHGSVTSKLMMKQVADPTPIEQLRPDVPQGLGDILRRLMARSPNDRYPLPADAARALAKFAAPEPEYLKRLYGAGRSTISDEGQTTTPTPSHYKPTRTPFDENSDGSSPYVSYRPSAIPAPTEVTEDAELQQTLRVCAEDLLHEPPAEDKPLTETMHMTPRKDRLPILLAAIAAGTSAMLVFAVVGFMAVRHFQAAGEDSNAKEPSASTTRSIP